MQLEYLMDYIKLDILIEEQLPFLQRLVTL